MFRKTLKLDVNKLKGLKPADSDQENGKSWHVTPKEGDEETLSLLTTVPLDGRAADLEGLLGRVPAGYKLFPLHTVAEVQFDGEEAK
jgi:hypothetical protein